MNTLLFFEFNGVELIFIAFALAYPLLSIICLIDIVRSDFKDSVTKLIWALIVLFAPFIGSIVYLIIGRKSKISVP
ncbi:PLD nuclease N-terminal domain-containing protein [Mucilaginibacter sp.]|uniref:PLD nuclease N-terminal domain-containing protein n=1 Tax=Mucilaginibacter sp. TaxID=1882438 RepID=UPI00261A05C9|nr:PLD nuclease N-terminal domain-containing protein [Mucilaginibacter sp.]MDB4926522.1 PLDc protein [Mucilaginibacter sp.]